MPIKTQRETLCRFLRNIAREKEISTRMLATSTGIPLAEVENVMRGSDAASLDQLIAIANELDMQLTFQHTISFAHRKAGNIN